MARAYTTRLLVGSGAGTTRTYTVPSGYRAVVRNLDCVNLGTSGAACWIAVAGGMIWRADALATNAHAHFETRQAARPGELIQVGTVGADVRFALTGYLFEDSSTYVSALPVPPGTDQPDPPALPKEAGANA